MLQLISSEYVACMYLVLLAVKLGHTPKNRQFSVPTFIDFVNDSIVIYALRNMPKITCTTFIGCSFAQTFITQIPHKLFFNFTYLPSVE